MTNPLSLAKHEMAEMLADADEVAGFLSDMRRKKREIHVIDAMGEVYEIDQGTIVRWAESIRKLSRMIEIE